MMRLFLPALASACLLAFPAVLARAQTAPPPAKPVPHHHHHRVTHHLRPQPGAPIPQPAPSETDAAGTTPAPVPNEDIGPPRAAEQTSPSLDPGSLRLHYPPLGDGYLPGSSPQDMANTQTPKVPGATYTVPLQQGVPQTLPPPGAEH